MQIPSSALSWTGSNVSCVNLNVVRPCGWVSSILDTWYTIGGYLFGSEIINLLLYDIVTVSEFVGTIADVTLSTKVSLSPSQAFYTLAFAIF